MVLIVQCLHAAQGVAPGLEPHQQAATLRRDPFSPAQLRVPLRLLVHLDYSFLKDVVAHFADGDENTQQSNEEIVLAALDGTPDEKLTGLAQRFVLSDQIGMSHEEQPDYLTDTEQVFAPRGRKP